MAYVEAHANLRDHLKTKKVARLLGIPKTQVIGHLLCLWWWCQEYAQDGDLSQYCAEDIAEAAEWTGDAEKFISALLNCGTKDGPGFLSFDENDHLAVNDWFEYGGKLFVTRAQAAKRMRNMRSRYASVTRNSTVTDASVTRIDQTRSDKIRKDDDTHARAREDTNHVEVEVVVGADSQNAVRDCYAENISSVLTKVITDDLAAMTRTYGEAMTLEAIREGGRNGARGIKYISTILRNWAAGDGAPGTNGKPPTENIPIPANVAELLR